MNGVRMSAAALERLRQQTTERDRELLRSLADHRFLTTNQLARLHFSRTDLGRVAVRACIRVLGRLRQLDLVTRLDRHVGGVRAGSAGFVWTLTVTGERLVRLGSGEPSPRTKHAPSLDHLAHTLAVAEVHLLMVELARAGLEIIETELEPACWRSHVGPDGARLTLKPDMSAITATGEYEDHWFIEIDRGREGMAVLLRKCAQYSAYARTGREQTTRGVFPYVLWLLPSEERLQRLQTEIQHTAGIDPALFRFATPITITDALTGTSPTPAGTSDTSTDNRLARLLAGGAHERF